MYLVVLAILLAAGALLARDGLIQRRPRRLLAGLLILSATLGLFGLMSFWGEFLWFEALGYGKRFWIFVAARVGACLLYTSDAADDFAVV